LLLLLLVFLSRGTALPEFILILLLIILVSSGKPLTFRYYGIGHCETNQHHEMQQNTHFKNHSEVVGEQACKLFDCDSQNDSGGHETGKSTNETIHYGLFPVEVAKGEKR